MNTDEKTSLLRLAASWRERADEMSETASDMSKYELDELVRTGIDRIDLIDTQLIYKARRRVYLEVAKALEKVLKDVDAEDPE